MIRTIGLLFLLPAAALAQPAPAAADCGQSVAALADHLGISLEADTASGNDAAGGQTGTQRLTATNGVVKPPDTGTHDVVRPPSVGDAMPTTPAIEPQAGSGSSTTPIEKGGATRIKLQSLLTAAQDSAHRGDDAQCRTNLDAAHRLADRP